MSAKVKIEVVAGALRGKHFCFDEHDTFVFGRATDCHIQMPPDDKTASRHHFLLEANPPDTVMRDLGSLNGTWVNGVKHGGRKNEKPDAVRLLKASACSGLGSCRRRRQRGEHLSRCVAWQVGAVEVGIEADESEIVPFGQDVLIGVVEIKPLCLHGGGHGVDIRTGEIEQNRPAVNKQIRDELIEQGQLLMASQDDAYGMEREIT